MLASENNYIAEASNTMLRLSAEEDIRKRCQDREEYDLEMRTIKKIIAEKDSLIQQLLEEIVQLKENSGK